MENKKETVVEWLKENLPSLFQDDSGHYQKLFEQAKEMEKKQIILAHGIKMKGVNNHKCVTGEQYYKETYGK
jgi:hypothetical protein